LPLPWPPQYTPSGTADLIRHKGLAAREAIAASRCPCMCGKLKKANRRHYKRMIILNTLLFLIFLVTITTVTVMTFLFRKKEYSIYDLWIHGKFMRGYLSRDVEEKYVRPLQILNYIAITSFLLCVAGILIDFFFFF
jgi:hypothetical protein